MRHIVDVLALEFIEGSNTIWIHGPHGTVLRIKTRGKITSEVCQTSPTAHCDIMVEDDIKICLASDLEE